MWKTMKFKAFTRWGLGGKCKLKKTKTEELKNNQLAVCFFKNDQRERENFNKETYHDYNRCFTKNCHISFLETVGWVGTALTIGLNFQLHSKRTCNINQESWQGNCSLMPSIGICSILRGLLFRLVTAMPGQSYGGKMTILPKGDYVHLGTDKGNNNDRNTGDSIGTPLQEQTPITQLESITKQFIGHTENLRGVLKASKDIHSAFKCFEKAQGLGSIKAHFNLGVCYETGSGTSVDLAKAAYHYQQAASGGHGLATYNLGVFYLEGYGNLKEDPILGLTLIRKAAEKDVTQAITYMGRHYLEETEFEKAISYLKKGVSKQDNEAYYYLGLCYENGWGVPVDTSSAAQYYSFAASHGHKDAEDALKTLGHLQLCVKQEDCTHDTESSYSRENKEPVHNHLNDSNESAYSSLHHSASSPELSQAGGFHFGKESVNISKYLDLIIPNIFLSPGKATFHVEAKDDYSITHSIEKPVFRNEVVAT